MRILISAFACEPNIGSEEEAGLQAVLTAASEHEVWVITRETSLPPLRAYLSSHSLQDRIHSIGLDVYGLPRRVERKGGLLTVHWYYDLWQRRLAELAVRLDDEVDFDVVHHATYAAYWNRAGVASVVKPFVWGPIGGGSTPPLRLLPVMGIRGAIADLTRILSRPAVAYLTGARRTARSAKVVLVQNPEVPSFLADSGNVQLLPNGLVAARSVDGPRPTTTLNRTEGPFLVTAGRLIGWKGTILAVMAMRYLQHPAVTLEVYGSGPQRARLERYARRAGVSDLVRFLGRVPREQVLDAIAGASALIHPALHDDSPLTIVEALAFGTPVVCLDSGGPPIIVQRWPDVPSRVVQPSTPDVTARRIAAALDDVVGQRGEPDSSPAEQFTEGLLAAYSNAATRA